MRYPIPLATIAIVLAAASIGHAQCSFNEPAKAKGLKSSLVRAYPPCPGVTPFPAPNTVTMAGIPACTGVFGNPPVRSSFSFGNKGRCSLKTSAKLESPCSTGSGIDCSNLTFVAKCSDVIGLDGLTPISAGAWSLNMVMRMTTNDPSGGDMTIIDFPVQAAFNPPARGKIRLRLDTNRLLNSLLTFGNEALPGCTAIELLSAAVADPQGDVFAVMGSSTR